MDGQVVRQQMCYAGLTLPLQESEGDGRCKDEDSCSSSCIRRLMTARFLQGWPAPESPLLQKLLIVAVTAEHHVILRPVVQYIVCSPYEQFVLSNVVYIKNQFLHQPPPPHTHCVCGTHTCTHTGPVAPSLGHCLQHQAGAKHTVVAVADSATVGQWRS